MNWEWPLDIACKAKDRQVLLLRPSMSNQGNAVLGRGDCSNRVHRCRQHRFIDMHACPLGSLAPRPCILPLFPHTLPGRCRLASPDGNQSSDQGQFVLVCCRGGSATPWAPHDHRVYIMTCLIGMQSAQNKPTAVCTIRINIQTGCLCMKLWGSAF